MTPSIGNQGAVHLPYSVVDMVTLLPKGERNWLNFINVFLPLSCLNIYRCFLQDFIKCHVQTFALPRWHCCKMQDMLLVCHGIIAGVSGAVKPVK